MGELTPETLTSEYQWIIFSGIPVFPRSLPSSSQVSGRRNLNVCPLTPRSLEATEHFTGDAWGTSFPRIYWENIMVYYGILLMNIMVYYGWILWYKEKKQIFFPHHLWSQNLETVQKTKSPSVHGCFLCSSFVFFVKFLVKAIWVMRRSTQPGGFGAIRVMKLCQCFFKWCHQDLAI